MPTPAAESANGGVGGAAKQVAEHASAIARLEVELASLELKQKAASLGIGAGLAVGAAVVAFYMVGFLFATLAAGLATFLAVWLALLIVTLFLGLVVVATRADRPQPHPEGLSARPGAGDPRGETHRGGAQAVTRTQAEIQRELEAEREQLAGAVEQLRDSFKLKPKLPALAAGAASVGFVLAGGVGATMRYFARRSRERH